MLHQKREVPLYIPQNMLIEMEQPTQKLPCIYAQILFITIYKHSLQKPTYCRDMQEELSRKQSVNICDELQGRHT